VKITAIATLTLVAAVASNAIAQAPARPAATRDTAVFAGGCFWGIQAVFERVTGVTATVSGFSGGTAVRPSYDDVSTGNTGHAESVEVIYDPARVTYNTLLKVFFGVALDPTELNHQGPDDGTQYRSALFVRNATQKAQAQAYIAELTRNKVWSKPIVTEVTPFKAFYAAESYHQGFYDANPTYPYIVYNDKPKVEALKKKFPTLYNGK
jgi:peptide-methionine (S)-S-oxide reductase